MIERAKKMMRKKQPKNQHVKQLKFQIRNHKNVQMDFLFAVKIFNYISQRVCKAREKMLI
jgi:hypothetical protein